MIRPLLTLCFFLFTTFLYGQEQLVKDITTTPQGILTSANYTDIFKKAGALAYFPITDKNGMELWRTDGTTAGTFMLKDINPGIPGGFSGEMAELNGKMIFVADDGLLGYELWISDGTAAGTTMVKDIYPGNIGSAPAKLFKFQNAIYFQVFAPNNNYELWKTDGTASGTVMVVNLSPSPINILINYTAAGNNLFYLGAQDSNGSPSKFIIWASDGTSAGTLKLKEFPGSFGSALTVIGDILYAGLNDGGGQKLWRSDGTVAGTYSIENMTVSNLIPFNGKLIFTAGGSALITDGTSSSAQTLYSQPIVSGQTIGGLFYGVTANAIVASDGTPGGTTKVADTGLVNVNGYLPFIGDRIILPYNPVGINNQTQEVGIFDTTNSSISLLKDVNSGAAGSYPKSWLNLSSNKIIFIADDDIHGAEIWITDGTPGGTELLSDTAPGTGDSGVSIVVATNDNVFFRGPNAGGGTALWKTTGSELSTTLLESTFTILGTVSNSVIGFIGGATPRIAKSNGTTTQTLFNLTGSSFTFRTVNFNAGGKFFFSIGGSAVTGFEPWVSDGTPTGTHILKDINPGVPGSSALTTLAAIEFNSKLLFAATTATAGNELWVSDGTETGTVMVKDINPGTSSSTPGYFTVLGNVAYFAATDATGTNLWKTDGVASGTTMVKDLYAGTSTTTGPTALVTLGNQVFFTSLNDAGQFRLWKSDGTDAGTTEVVLIGDGNGISNLVAAGNKIYFLYNGPNGLKLYSSDGTVSGTQLISVVAPVTSVVQLRSYVVDNVLYFTIGHEMWRTGGTDGTTVKVAGTSIFTAPALYDGWMYFGGATTEYGRELFKIKHKQPQLISMSDFTAKKYGDADFDIIASAASGLALTYDVAPADVVQITNGKIKIMKAGTVMITARQAGNDDYDPASLSKTLTISKADQVITFDAIAPKTFGDPSFNLSASINSGLQLSYTTSTSDKVTITGTQVQLLKGGKAKITVSQPGNENFNAAVSKDQEFCINPVKPSISVILTTGIPGSAFLTSSYDGLNKWYKDNVILSNTTRSISVSAPGAYTVKASADECESLASDPQVIVVTSVESASKIELHPVPSKDKVILSLPEYSGQAVISIHGTQSNLMMELITTKRDNELDISSFSPGVYIVRINCNGEMVVRKIVKI